MSDLENKKLLFIVTRRFWPVDSGRKLSLYHYCRGLHDVYGYDIYIYSFLDVDQTPKNAEPKPYFIKNVVYAKSISMLEKLINLAMKSFFSFKRIPFQCSLYYSKKNDECIKKLAEKLQPQVVIVDMVRLAPYFDAFSHLECKKILDMDDILSKRYRRQLECDITDSNYMGAYAGSFGGLVRKALNLKILKRFILKRETRLLENAEKYYALTYDSTILVSKIETQYLNDIIKHPKAFTITVGADYEYFSEECNIEKKENTLSFVGNLKIAANADSLNLIVTNVLPMTGQDVKLYMIGASTENVKRKYKDCSNVIFTGMVDDLRKYVKETQVFISPIAYGSGIKTKIIEAMAMGMPVVTNSIGAEGLNVTDGRELFVKDDYVDMIKAVIELLNDERLRKEIGRRGQKFVQQYHDWNIVYKTFEKMGL